MSHLLVLTFSSAAVVAPKSWIMKKKEWFHLGEVNIPAAVNSGFKIILTCWKQTDPAESQVRSKWQKYSCESIHCVRGEWLVCGLPLVIYLFLPCFHTPPPTQMPSTAASSILPLHTNGFLHSLHLIKHCPSMKIVVVVQSLSCVHLFATPWTSQSLLKFMFIESVVPSNHLILCQPLLLPSFFPSIRVYSNESALCIRWPKYWSFSFSISPSCEYSGLISFRSDWFDL